MTLLSFSAIVLVTILIAWLTPPRYDARIRILVKRERLDPVVGAEPNQPVVARDMTETDLNSEVELLKSRDISEKVVIETGLATDSNESLLERLKEKLEPSAETIVRRKDQFVLRAIRKLENELKIEPLKKTNLIEVSYGSKDAQLSAKVLQTLVRLYLEKHLAVHRVPGALDFFQSQTRLYQENLTEAEQKLVEFGNQSGVVAAQLQKEMTVRKLSDLETQLQQTQASITETEQRVKVLEEQAAATPARLVTQMRTTDNSALLQQIKTTLLDLELKRTELSGKYAADYRPIQELDAQIEAARNALTSAEKNPVREEVTDRDVTHEWIRGELARARAELTALRARVVGLSDAREKHLAMSRQLNEIGVLQDNLVRSAKTAEENYLLYSHKQEEARISDALDQQRIVNVSLAEDAAVPALPSSRNRMAILMIGTALALLTSIACAALLDWLDRSFRTPDEVEAFLDIPVLASLPIK
jgi:uncharacterized protein involved in exopolysaccharide biosynthesis